MKVVVTIPAYNEARSVGEVVRDVKSVMKKSKYNFDIMVLDDGSKDATAQVAAKAGAKVYKHKRNRGLARTFRDELKYAVQMKADVIVHIDADGQYQAQSILKLLEKIDQGHDLVLGSRFRGKIESMPFTKRFGNQAFSFVLTQLTGTRITDGQTGLRAFTRDVAEEVEITSTFSYTQEQIIRAEKQGFSIAEVPVYFARRKHGTSRLFRHPVEFAFRAWITIFRIYRDYDPIKFFGILGGLFIGAGGVIGLYLFYLFLTTGIVGRLPTAMLSVLLISIGVQIVLFGFLADMLKK